MKIAVVGGGPAGLRAAEVAAAQGATVDLYEAKPSVGRKLLVAGRGGLNLTHGEAIEGFIARYSGPGQPEGFWNRALEKLSPEQLREWAAGLGIETFQQRTGRVYPREMKAAPLLRRWVERLKAMGVSFHSKHRLIQILPSSPLRLRFEAQADEVSADAVILALGGGSWSITGSDGTWVTMLQELGIEVNPLRPANCGWETTWPQEVLDAAEGSPLKNLRVRAGGVKVKGELMVTSYGLEGGTIYQLGSVLRAMDQPAIEIDFKPEATAEDLARKMESVRGDIITACRERWKLTKAAHAILTNGMSIETPLEILCSRAKACPIRLSGPRPIDEAISSAGGVCWSEIDDKLMLRKLPGIFVAGEMIDWEAPTGGYLMQGCFATGQLAAEGALILSDC
ncbi:TIGR03862 family flavoprotein [Haloferula sp. BvORR071]|uniref:NAD(P)/FAD-dependent oxidoreductase n=1 Tax=Haloferula sp. BvORR071 TaxID=1396141 RepID=UPI000550704D|nr:TIGR03862 family flavoprotein [Haloferula sp. BvORR071]